MAVIGRLVGRTTVATTAPTVNDDAGDGYRVGDRWVRTNGDLYTLTDNTPGAAVWTDDAPAGGGGGGLSDGDYGDITVSGSGTVMTIDAGVVDTTELAANAVTLAKLADIATDRLLGRDTAGSGDPEELTVGGGLEFTGAGGIQRSALSGDVSASAGSGTTAIGNNKVTDAMLRDGTACSVIGRSANSSGDPADISAASDGQYLRRASGSLGFGALPAAATHTWYDPEAPVTGASYTATYTQEFATSASAGSWTTAWDVGAIGVAQSVGAGGLEIDIPTGGGTTKIAGYHVGSWPTGDFAVGARIGIVGGLSNFQGAGLMLIQGTGATDDVYYAGFFASNGNNQPVAEVGSLTAYNAGALTGIFASTSGPVADLYVVMRWGSASGQVTTFIGTSPDNLTLADLNRTLGWGSGARILLGGWGQNRKIKLTCRHVRVLADTYPGATFDYPLRLSGALFSGS